jgi:hypothetical protein
MLTHNADQNVMLQNQDVMLQNQNEMLQHFMENFDRLSNASPHDLLPLKQHRADDSVVDDSMSDELVVTAPSANTAMTNIANEALLSLFNQQVILQLGIEFKSVAIDVTPTFLLQEQVKPLYVFKKKLRDPMHDEKFFPNKSHLFLQHAMTDILNHFLTTKETMYENDRDADQWVLIGSPGIGKSLLFFLGAVAKVVRHNKHIVYFWKAEKESISIFYLFPSEDSKYVVNFFFKRFGNDEEIINNEFQSLEKLLGPIYHAVNCCSDSSRKVLLFLDGPTTLMKERHI